MKYTVLYNPFSSSRRGRRSAERLKKLLGESFAGFEDITSVTDFSMFFDSMKEDCAAVVCGGDGTLNRLINAEGFDPDKYADKLFCCPGGSGNDFYKDIKHREKKLPVPLKEYFTGLPTAEIDGKFYRFLNGLGAGIDGFVCELGNRLRDETGKKVNYTACALKGLLGKYTPIDVKITVDGIEHMMKSCWLTPVMNGRYFGGGMKATPDQDRLSSDGKLSMLSFCGSGRFKTLCIFPVIFSGGHVKIKKHCTVLTGNEIKVEYSSPQCLQIDGETIPGVKTLVCRKAPRADQ